MVEVYKIGGSLKHAMTFFNELIDYDTWVCTRRDLKKNQIRITDNTRYPYI